ncbi:MAG: di-trans,poly-cis-decaprenylcistransferase [Hyphomicrobiales bacterium]
MQSNLDQQGLHVAIIMDGNGRWGTRRGLPRAAGHRAGFEAVRRVVEAAPEKGVRTLTLFAFSSANWRRPPEEVSALMSLFRQFLRTELPRLLESGTRLTVIGRRDRLPCGLSEEIARAEMASARGQRLNLRIAVDYSSRQAIGAAAASWLAEFPFSRDVVSRDVSFGDLLDRLLARQADDSGKDVDLLIRSGGEKRLSDFLLWECAYAELCFLDKMWPDFDAEDLAAAIADFRCRERTFGALGAVEPRDKAFPEETASAPIPS